MPRLYPGSEAEPQTVPGWKMGHRRPLYLLFARAAPRFASCDAPTCRRGAVRSYVLIVGGVIEVDACAVHSHFVEGLA